MAKEKKTGTLQIVSLGDSLTRGVGDKERWLCWANERGFTKDYKQKLH